MVVRVNDNLMNDTSALPRDVPVQLGFSTRLKSAVRHGVLRSAAPFRRWLGVTPAGAFGILMYHRITPNLSGVAKPTWNVTPQRFRRQLAGLLRRGFQPCRLSTMLDRSEAGKPALENSFVVTFDDGYANNYMQALPILRELNIPATIFLATAYLDSDRPFPSDDWTAAGLEAVPADAWRPLTTAEADALNADDLIDLGAHTHTHADFRNRPAALEADLHQCRQVLRRKFGIDKPMFAFPYGTKHLGFSGPVLANAAKRTGVRCALTTESEVVTPNACPFDWGRFTAEGSDTAGTLAMKLSGGFEKLRAFLRRGCS